jgi:hypothetical protein
MQDCSVTFNQNEPGHHRHHWTFFRIVGWTAAGIVFAVLFAFVFGIVVKLLWNALMPAIFGLGTITYWQAVGIVVLARLVFGSFGEHHGHRKHRGYRWHHGHHGMHDRFRKKWSCMGHDNDDDECWKPNGSYKNWKYYDQYWKEEGKAAFEAYVDKIEAQNGKNEK